MAQQARASNTPATKAQQREQKLQAFVSSSGAQSKMQAFMAGMKAKMQALQEARGEGAPITKEDIGQNKNELMAEMGGK